MGKLISIPLIAISIYGINGYSTNQNEQDEVRDLLPNTLKHLSKYFRKRTELFLSPSQIDKINQEIFSRKLLMNNVQSNHIAEFDKEMRTFFKETDAIQTKFKIFYDQFQQILIKLFVQKSPSEPHEQQQKELKLIYKEIQFYPFMTTFIEIALRHDQSRKILYYLLARDENVSDDTYDLIMNPLEIACKDILQNIGKDEISHQISLKLAIFVYKRLYHEGIINELVPISSAGYPISFKHPETIFGPISPNKYLYAIQYDLFHLTNDFLGEHGHIQATQSNFGRYVEALAQSEYFAAMPVLMGVEMSYQFILALLKSHDSDLSSVVSGNDDAKIRIRTYIQNFLSHYYRHNNKEMEHDLSMQSALKDRNIYDIIIGIEESRRLVAKDNGDPGNIKLVPKTIVLTNISSILENSPNVINGHVLSFRTKVFDQTILKLMQQEEYLLKTFKTFYIKLYDQLQLSGSFEAQKISYLRKSYKELVFHPFMSTLVENIISSRNEQGPRHGPMPAFLSIMDEILSLPQDASANPAEINPGRLILKGLQKASIDIMRNAYPTKYHGQGTMYPPFQYRLSLSSWYYQEFYQIAIDSNILPQYPYNYQIHTSSILYSSKLLTNLNEQYPLSKEYNLILYTEYFFKSLGIKNVIQCKYWHNMRNYARELMAYDYYEKFATITYKFLLTLLQSDDEQFDIIEKHNPNDMYLAFWQRILIKKYKYLDALWIKGKGEIKPDMTYISQMKEALETRKAVQVLLQNSYNFVENRMSDDDRTKFSRFYL